MASRIGVCSWSLSPTNPAELVSSLADCGLSNVQLAFGPLVRFDHWRNCTSLLTNADVRIVSGMVGCVGEDYTSIDSIRRTGGVVPDETWPMTLEHMRAAAPIAESLGLKLITFHAGFIPADVKSPVFGKVLDRVGQAADLFAQHGCAIALETGQESADALLAFLQQMNRPDVGANFDPANMLLYASGDPIAALKKLMPWVKQVHIKDAIASGTPGQWGREMPAGKGAVAWANFFGVLKEGNYRGQYVIEREAGANRGEDVQKAAELIRHYAGDRQISG